MKFTEKSWKSPKSGKTVKTIKNSDTPQAKRSVLNSGFDKTLIIDTGILKTVKQTVHERLKGSIQKKPGAPPVDAVAGPVYPVSGSSSTRSRLVVPG